MDQNTEIFNKYLDGMSMRDISIQYDISYQYVSMIIKEVRDQKSKILYNRYLFRMSNTT